MSFLKGSSPVYVFKVIEHPTTLPEFCQRSTFEREAITRVGSLTDDADFLPVGGFLALGYRLDVKRAPNKLVKIEVANRINAAKTIGAKLSRARKAEIKEAVIETLALAAHPTIASADMVFDGSRLYVFGTAAMADRVMQLIHRAGGELERIELNLDKAVVKLHGLTRDGYQSHGDPAHMLIVDKASLLDTMGMVTTTLDIGIAQRMIQENLEDYSVTQCLFEVRTTPGSAGEERTIGKALVKVPTSPGGSVQLAINPPVSDGEDDDTKVLDRFEGFKRIFGILASWINAV